MKFKSLSSSASFSFFRISKFFSCSLILIASAISVQAQEADETPSSGKISGYCMDLGFGASLIDPSGLSKLNEQLRKNNYALVSSQSPIWNLEFAHIMYKNTVFNFNMGGLMKRNTVSDSSKTTMSGTNFGFGFGKVICHSNKNLFYPMIGASFGNMQLHSHFTGINKASDISGTNAFRALDISINFDHLFNGTGKKLDWKSGDPGLKGTGVLSFSAGYIYSPVNTFWNDSNYDISSRFNSNVNYPANVLGSLTSSNFSMFYFSVKMGFGCFTKS